MSIFRILLQTNLNFTEFKFSLLAYCTAFALTLIFFPPVLYMVKRLKLFDRPGPRKAHKAPIPTFGGIAIFAGTIFSLLIWYTFNKHPSIPSFFISITVLFGIGMLDDLKDLAVRYKFIIELSLATLLAISGIRITSLGGLFGVNELHLAAQYTLTVITIVGITNAFNLIDGIDGLAGGLGFMSLITLGIFLTLGKDFNYAMIAFALAGSLLAFLYFNFNPARIFMGDTGSLVSGFVIAVLCVELIKISHVRGIAAIPNVQVFTLGIVLIPVFDALKVFSRRMWKGQSPFLADKTHIHHLITNEGFSHGLTARMICVYHGFILILVYWMKNIKPEWQLLILVSAMFVLYFLLNYVGLLRKFIRPSSEVMTPD